MIYTLIMGVQGGMIPPVLQCQYFSIFKGVCSYTWVICVAKSKPTHINFNAKRQNIPNNRKHPYQHNPNEVMSINHQTKHTQ